ncbi:unnamed protein product [Colias eurytheme]|nr:unnamed protein product [Colias eurytheme]
MSSVLVREALAFVDPEENEKNKNKRSRKRSNPGQGKVHPYNNKNKNKKTKEKKSQEEIVDSNIKKLLALSAPVANTEIADKIIERAVKGKPLLEKIEKKVEEEKSILFPEESFKKTNYAFMDLPDALLGKVGLVLTFTVFAIFVFWVNSYPFIDDELTIYKYIPNPQWALLFCAVWGLFFIGGLMSFTLYHLYPYL